MSGNTINYRPPPILRAFIKHYLPGELFYDWVVGPVGSGKTTGIFFKLIRMAKLQAASPDGIRRSRAVVVRNTMPMLRDTTIPSWGYWFKHGQAGDWHATDKKFTLRFDDVECEVLFRALDTPDDVGRVLSLEVTFVIIDEFVEIPREIVDALSARAGRYPSQAIVPGGATNWGMWGSSNPSTEDNWWFEYLHNRQVVEEMRFPNDEDAQAAFRAFEKIPPGLNARYYKQPSGFTDEAENVENLPGGRAYYTNQAKGKSEAWIKQFLESEWGYSVTGTPVVPTFKADIHVARKTLNYDPLLPMVIGVDPGVTHSAYIFGQQDLNAQLRVLGEITLQGVPADRAMKDHVLPYIRRRFPEMPLDMITLAPDPQAGARNAATDEAVVVKVLKDFFPVSIESNNRLPLRLNAIEHFTTRLTGGGPALIIDPTYCPVLIRALKGGWRYVMDTKRGMEKPEPDKNKHSHPGDAFGYLCRYYHRGAERELRYGKSSFTPPKFGSAYHVR